MFNIQTIECFWAKLSNNWSPEIFLDEYKFHYFGKQPSFKITASIESQYLLTKSITVLDKSRIPFIYQFSSLLAFHIQKQNNITETTNLKKKFFFK